MPPATHRIAACAYIYDTQARLLLLKRSRPPLCWAPPGGRLEPDEDPLQGLRREVLEECGLQIEVLGLAGCWFGSSAAGAAPLVGLDYIAVPAGGELALSPEHYEAAWASRADLAAGRYPLLDEHGAGYRLAELELAWDLYGFYLQRHRRS